MGFSKRHCSPEVNDNIRQAMSSMLDAQNGLMNKGCQWLASKGKTGKMRLHVKQS